LDVRQSVKVGYDAHGSHYNYVLLDDPRYPSLGVHPRPAFEPPTSDSYYVRLESDLRRYVDVSISAHSETSFEPTTLAWATNEAEPVAVA